tara:strand:- start:226 stop:1467 length:1242 start_codon:yes stop_codon:yes gene_type:complete
MLSAQELAQQIDPNAKQVGDQWKCRCPAHEDTNPSFYVKDSDGLQNPLVHCFAGCTQQDVVKSLTAMNLWGLNEQTSYQQKERERQQRLLEESMQRLRNSIESGDEAGIIDYFSEPVPEPYRTATWADVANRFNELPEEQWVCGPIQSGSIGFIAAKPGVGKSMLALGLANSISRGTPFADWNTPQPLKVTLIDVELSTRFMYDRMSPYEWDHNMRFDWQDWREAFSMESFCLGNPYHHKVVFDTCEDSDVIIIDNVTFALEPVRPGEIFNPETWQRVTELTMWAKTRNKTIIFVDHTNKADAIAGSMNKQRSADWVILLDAVSLPGAVPLEFTLKFDKVRYKVDSGLTANKYVKCVDAVWSMEGVPTVEEEISEMVVEGLTYKQIADEMGMSESTIKRKIKSIQHHRVKRKS